jgi:tetratricopeptide (TPR) repeat protein
MRSAAVVAFTLSAALAAFCQAPEKDPRALLDRAIAAEKAGQAEAAERQLQEILRNSNPPVAVAGQARLELVRIYERRGEWWQAAAQLQELRKLAPEDPEYAYQLGVVYKSLSKWAFERMRATAPRSARTYQMLGEQYSIAGDTEKAIGRFRQAIEADPKLPGSHLALAVILLRQNKRDEALAEIGKELLIAPESVMAKTVRQAITGGRP